MSWRGVLAVVLVLVGLAAGWSLWRQRVVPATPLEGGRPDYVLENFEMISLDANGQESFTLRAPRLTRDPAVRTLAIATPLFIIPPRAGQSGTPWEVRSKTGWVSAKGDEIRLRGDVRATTTNESGNAVRMDSQQLNVFPDAKRATSSVQVRLTQPGLILDGHSLDAKLDTKRVFLKDIKARYDHSR
ncbi:MAG: LPS export ABC transporter periplasmic protein LptC [Lysobacter sp.]|nr:MAG: LPS export ABC transporter periplasmic protein LptC [Lysobacter sp.]